MVFENCATRETTLKKIANENFNANFDSFQRVLIMKTAFLVLMMPFLVMFWC